jgi:hypothetical protein
VLFDSTLSLMCHPHTIITAPWSSRTVPGIGWGAHQWTMADDADDDDDDDNVPLVLDEEDIEEWWSDDF